MTLISSHPLAWVVSNDDGAFGATPLPLLAETDANGDLVALFGHFGLANPQVAQLRASPRAMIIASGPQAYVSPRLVSRQRWAPTWNYAAAVMQVEIEFVPDETRQSLDRLLDHLEPDSSPRWQVEQVGDRMEQMLSRIIAFRAHVRSWDGRFKLGQDEAPATLREIIDGIGDPDVAQWMEMFNADRLSSPSVGTRQQSEGVMP